MLFGHDPVTWGLVAVGLVVAHIIYVRRIKRHGLPEWDPRPPTDRERIIVGLWLLAFLLAIVNYYCDWQLFGGYDNWAVLALSLAGLFLFERLPGVTHT